MPKKKKDEKPKIDTENRVVHDTISDAINSVMSELKMIMKDKTSDGGGDYLYTSAAFAASMIRPLMIKNGIIRYSKSVTHLGRWQNGIGVDYNFIFRYVLVGSSDLVEDINYIDTHVPASGKVGKSGDKSTYAAITTGGKYADLITYYLPMIDDVEEFEELMDVLENGETEKPKKKRGKVKPEAEKPEPEEEEAEVMSTSSKDYNYSDGVLDLIQKLFDEGGIEAVEQFTDGDGRKEVVNLVEELSEEEVEEEPEEKPKPKKSNKKKSSSKRGGSRVKTKKDKKSKKEEPEEEELEYDDLTDKDGYLDLDELDYDNPAVVAALLKNIDLEDAETFSDCIDSFEDREQMKAFYTVCLEKAGEEGPDFQTDFNEEHFKYLQERFEDLD